MGLVRFPFCSCCVAQHRFVLMHQRKPRLQTTGSTEEGSSSYLAPGKIEGKPSIIGSNLMRESDTFSSDRETPLPRTITQSPESLVSGLPTSSILSPPHLVRLRCATGHPSIIIDCGGNALGDNASEQTVMVSPVGEIAIDENDIIVAVTGPTGAGKSTFIGRAVGRPEIGVGHDLESCTSEIRAVRYPHSDGERNIVLVDTPGFDDTFVTDTQILRNIANWLHYTYKQNVKLSGLLYLHRISDNRVAGTPLRNLNMFKELCGEDSFKNVILVTTMWDEILEDVGLQREEELQNTFWQRMIKLGSSAQRFDGTEESAWKIINSISVSPSRERSGLQIQREMVDQHRPVHRTSAGKVVLDSFSGLFTGFKGFFKRIGQRPNGRKYNLSDPGSFPFQMPSSSYSMASTATLSDSSTGGSDWTTNTEFSSSGACIEHGYRDALSVAITDLKLALSVADFVHIPCLKDIIIPSIKIASSVESMERAHHGLYQIVENAALLINVITEHAQRGRLSPDTKAVISTLSKALLCIENLVQHLAQQNSQAQEVLQHDDARAISSCANSMRMACDSLRSKLPAENRQTLFRIEVGLATVMQGLEERCHCGIPREALRHLSV